MRESPDRRMRTRDHVQRKDRDRGNDPDRARALYAGKGPTVEGAGRSASGRAQPAQRAPLNDGPVAQMQPWVDVAFMRALGMGGFDEPAQRKGVEEKASSAEPVQRSPRKGGPVASMEPWPDAGFMRALGIGGFEAPVQRKPVEDAPSSADLSAYWDQTAARSATEAGLAPIQMRTDHVGGDACQWAHETAEIRTGSEPELKTRAGVRAAVPRSLAAERNEGPE